MSKAIKDMLLCGDTNKWFLKCNVTDFYNSFFGRLISDTCLNVSKF